MDFGNLVENARPVVLAFGLKVIGALRSTSSRAC